jgi:hypothetical protein
MEFLNKKSEQILQKLSQQYKEYVADYDKDLDEACLLPSIGVRSPVSTASSKYYET